MAELTMSDKSPQPRSKKANLWLALGLVAIALAFYGGFIALTAFKG